MNLFCNETARTAAVDLAGLALFDGVRAKAPLHAFHELLSPIDDGDASELARRWATFMRELADSGATSFSQAVARLTLADDNRFTRAAESGEALTPLLETLARADLCRLARVASFDLSALGLRIAETVRNAGAAQSGETIADEARALAAAAGDAVSDTFPPRSGLGEAQGAGHPSGEAAAAVGDAVSDTFPPRSGLGEAQGAGHPSGEAAAAAVGEAVSDTFSPRSGLGEAQGAGHPSGEATAAAAGCQTLFPAGGAWEASLAAFCRHIHAHGAGELGLYRAFRWDTERGALLPVRTPDAVRLRDLAGYAEQRAVVVANTRRFLDGNNANNLLLYGDRGTGKSATVKALGNEFAQQGLRLVELPKQSLTQLSRVLETLGERALRFVLFIDDLTFERLDDSFTSLKALLEGDIEARPPNVVVYATSNRRHLVKEALADRPNTTQAAHSAESGDMRAFDTMQEQYSLADRFGLTVVFTAPGQEAFLDIAEHIALQRGLLTQRDEQARRTFRANALRWERWFNGRSPRTAVQYVDWLAGGATFPWEA
jgi:predicted AAA+ superfamily ATPase